MTPPRFLPPPFAAPRLRRRRPSPLAWLPLLLLLLVWSTAYLFGDGWGGFYQPHNFHDRISAQSMVIADNLSPSHNFLMFLRRQPGPDGAAGYEPYTRFPIGGYALIKLFILPFGDDLSAKIYAAQMLMLLMFAGAAALAYLSLRRITARPWIAFTATLLAFSSYHLLYYSDMVSNETAMDLFGMLLVFHGMTVFIQERRFGQLLVKAGLALLLGWHVYALLLPFIVFGLGGEIIRALRRNIPGNAIAARIRAVAAALLRSRYLRLGAAALLFGVALLSFNIAGEYAALEGELPLRNLPSVRSILNRAGLDADFSSTIPSFVAWERLLPQQFGRIGNMSLPYALTAHTQGLDELNYSHSPGPLYLPYPAIGMAAAGVCLLALLFARRYRMLLASLCLAGLFWGIGMRHNTAQHDFESVHYIGIPLVLFTLMLLALRHRCRRPLPAVIAVAALSIFILSGYQIGQREALGHEQRPVEGATMSEFQEIRRFTHGKKVYMQSSLNHKFDYYLTGSVNQLVERPISDCGPQCGRYFDFIISADRHLFPDTHLLTPSHRHIFLFDAKGIDSSAITARYRSEYQAITDGDYGPPTARAEYDLFLSDGKLIYYKSQCRPADKAHKFLLHPIPDDPNDLPEKRRRHGFENLDFDFLWRGEVFDGDCLIIAPLPDYPIARIRTGQYQSGVGRKFWEANFPTDIEKYIAEYETITSDGYGKPAARASFDVHQSETALIYLKEPCAPADTEARFFLHLFPENESDLPAQRQEYGFENRGFWFIQRGAVTGDRCLAIAPLPGYPIDRIYTGQFISGQGRLWAVEFPDARQPGRRP